MTREVVPVLAVPDPSWHAIGLGGGSQRELGALLDVAEEEAQPAVGRALPGEALIRGEVCEGDEAALPVVSQPVGRILTAGEVVQPEGPSEMMSEYY